MDANVTGVLIECTRASDDEASRFPEILARLATVGVERYHADLVRSEKTYYLPEGHSAVVPCHPVDARAAEAFSAPDIEAAVRASQKQEIGYREFCRRVMRAGCVGYQVSLAGRRAVYYGRTGQTHVEHFPPS